MSFVEVKTSGGTRHTYRRSSWVNLPSLFALDVRLTVFEGLEGEIDLQVSLEPETKNNVQAYKSCEICYLFPGLNRVYRPFATTHCTET